MNICLKLRTFLPVIFLILFLVLSSCSHYLNVTAKSNEELNNGGNPVVVRIYLLKTDVNFQRATLEAFWRNDRESLGADIVGEPIEIMLHPSETRKLKKLKLNKEVFYIGAAADFYQPDKNQWKYLYNLAQLKGDDLVLAVGKDKLIILKPEK
ncbi:MAG: type VI secretion system lipoprotein TssJ [bacterium]|nr:MAG: type VI secretion system lipoprotein TssJ [bacterium]